MAANGTHRRSLDIIEVNMSLPIPGSTSGFPTGYGEKLSGSHAEPDKVINSAVAYFPYISCGAFRGRTGYYREQGKVRP